MKPNNLKTKIFLDSGNPEETKEITSLLGFLDGQTTNPTLIAKNPKAQERLKSGKKFTGKEIWDFYKKNAEEISNIIPAGSVSLEVYSDRNTGSEEMLKNAKEMYKWIPNAHIKLPLNKNGLEAAEKLIIEGLRINITLCFSQEQAAAVYCATNGAGKGQVFVSPFIGRLDDRGENGMDVVENIITMYKQGDGHVEVLAASIRNLNHFLCAIKLGADIITAPYKILKEWSEQGMPMPNNDFICAGGNLKDIPYYKIDLMKDWHTFNIAHPLTDVGMETFSKDWNNIIDNNK